MTDERSTPGTVHDRRPPRWTSWLLAIFVAFLIVAGVAVVAVVRVGAVAKDGRDTAERVARIQAQQAREAAARRDQSCRVDETTDREEVTRLIKTYQYLADLTPRQRQSPLSRAIFAQLPEVEKDAQTINAPPFCREPGVGLPADTRRVPERPAALIGH